MSAGSPGPAVKPCTLSPPKCQAWRKRSPTQLPLAFATRPRLHFLGKDFLLCPSCRPQGQSRTGERRGPRGHVGQRLARCPTTGQEVPGASTEPGPFQKPRCKPRAALLFVFRLLVADQTPTVRTPGCVWSLRLARGGGNPHSLGFRDTREGRAARGPKPRQTRGEPTRSRPSLAHAHHVHPLTTEHILSTRRWDAGLCPQAARRLPRGVGEEEAGRATLGGGSGEPAGPEAAFLRERRLSRI